MRIGYGRVSTRDQNPGAQREALAAAGCERVFVDTASGKLASRPELDNALMVARPGDEFVVTRLGRLGRSLEHLIELAGELQARGVHLVALNQGIDTSTAVGRMVFHILGAIAEFSAMWTRPGLTAARARRSQGGRPTVMTLTKPTAARQIYNLKSYTIAEIAMLGVSRATIYGHLGMVPRTARG